MESFPSDFSALLSQEGVDYLNGRVVPPVDLREPQNHFFALDGVIAPAKADGCLRLLERDFGGKLSPIVSQIPPESISGATRNFSESLKKTMYVDSVIFNGSNKSLESAAHENGLLRMLQSESLRNFAEQLTGLSLEAGYGTQVICYRHGHYVGPHTDHFPEFAWARDGYVDVQFTFSNDAVAGQWFIHERDGLLSETWDINLMGAVTVFRQPFWHYTTPLLGRKGREKHARRWLVGQVFKIRQRSKSNAERQSNGELSEYRHETASEVAHVSTTLSESVVWDWQREFYEETGQEAWNAGIVPYQVTSSPAIALAYGKIIAAYLKDVQHSRQTEQDQITDDPIYILDLGAGTGRLAYLIAKALSNSTDLPRFRYVMVDAASSNIQAWAKNPQFASLLESGVLDYACYDAVAGGPIRLEHSGETVEPGNTPLVAIANYFFDSLPQDVLMLQKGSIVNGQASVLMPTHETDPGTGKKFPLDACQVQLSYHHGDALRPTGGPWNDLISNLAGEVDGAYLFPVGALRVLDNLRHLAGRNLMVLAADKGCSIKVPLAAPERLTFAAHGSVSLEVDFHALATYCINQDGLAVHAPSNSSLLGVHAMLWGSQRDQLTRTLESFDASFGQLGPLDIHALSTRLADKQSSAPPLSELMAVLRLSEADPVVLCRHADHFRQAAKEARPDQRDNLAALLDKVWAHHFALGKQSDPAFEIATILQLMGLHSRAYEYYERSLDEHGDHFTTLFNMAVCLAGCDKPKAISLFKRTLQVNPQYQPAQEWCRRLVGSE